MIVLNAQVLQSQGKCSISFLWNRYESEESFEERKFNAELLLFAEVNKLVRDGRKYFVESQGWRSQLVQDKGVRSWLWQLDYRVILAEPAKAEIGDIVYLSVVGEEYSLRDRTFKRKAENVWLRVS